MSLAFHKKSPRRKGVLASAGVLTPLLAIILAIGVFGRHDATATVTTDKPDYTPGSVVTISGDNSNGFGYQPGETVTVHVTHDENDWEAYCQPSPVVAADGSWSCQVTLSADPSVAVGSYTYTATRPDGTYETGHFTDGSIGTYDQCANDDGDGYSSGGKDGCDWINGNLNKNNSTYPEGTATVQRLAIFEYVPGSTHTVTFVYGTTKGGKHAYDFLTHWNWSEDWIAEADLCQQITGCATADSSENAHGIPPDPNVDDAVEFADAGLRQFVMRGGTITGVSTPAIASGSYAGDSETSITVSFTVGPSSGPMCSTKQNVTTCGVVLWFGAHVALGDDWEAFNGTTGAGSIAGSPYHVQLAAEDGASIGQRDNQMQASAVIGVEPAVVVIQKVCVGDGQATFDFDGTGTEVDPEFQLACGASTTFNVVPGIKTVTEATPLPTDWEFTSLVCQSQNSPNGNANTPTTVSGRTATIGADAGETVTCTFTNTLVEPPQASVSVSKTANTTFTRTCEWDITKTTDETDTTAEIADGAQATFNYNVTAISTGCTDSAWEVSGTITVVNDGTVPALINDVTDSIASAVVTCPGTPFPITIAVGGQLQCTYTAAMASGAAGSNVATAVVDDGDNPDLEFESEPAGFSFTTPTTTVNGTVTVTDTLGGNLGTCSVGNPPCPFAYPLSFPGVAGTCTDYPNTATIVETGDTASATVRVCVGLDLEVTKTATPSYNRTHDWSIDKSVDDTTVEIADGGTATFTYTVNVTYNGYLDSRIVVGGLITISNPNDWQAITLTSLVDAVDNGGTCVFVDNGPYVVQASGSINVGYRCTYATVPAGTGTNTATATWDAAAYHTPTGSDSGTADATFGEPANEAYETITVTDTYEGVETTLGSCTAPGPCVIAPYSHTESGVGGTCTQYDNTAEITGTGETSSETVTLCVGLDLEVTKTATPSYNRTHDWSIDKSVDDTTVEIADGGTATFTYTVNVTYNGYVDSRIVVGGLITISNPNEWQAITLTSLVDAVDNGGACVFVDNGPYVVPASGSINVGYRCTYATVPAGTGTNTATATWDAAAYHTPTGSDSGTADATFGEPADEAYETITVTDTYEGVETTLGSCTAPGPCVIAPYSHTESGVGGTCTQFDNTAEITETGETSSETVTLCVGLDLVVTKTATPSYIRTHSWSIDKSSPKAGTHEIVPGPDYIIDYSVTVSYGGYVDSRIVVGGLITISNPNGWQAIHLTSLVDAVDNGGTCVFLDNGPYVVPAGGAIQVGYRCTYASVPAGTGTNTATATWDAAAYHTPTGSDSGTADATFGDPASEVDETITVVDSPYGPLGQCSAPNSCTWNYSRTIPTTSLGCRTLNVDNTATIVETNQSDSVRVTLDASCVNGKTQGFWGNNNGQALLTAEGFTTYTLGNPAACRVVVTLANSKTVLPGEKKGHNGLSISQGCDVKGGARNGFNNLLSQTLALYFNITYITDENGFSGDYAGQTIAGLNCVASAAGTGLSGSNTVEEVLAAANALIGMSGSGNVGAFNELLGCLNREQP